MSRAGIAWEQAVIDLAHYLGWKVVSFASVRIQRRDGSYYWATATRADGNGWPDLVLVRDDDILFRELKTGKARLTVEQREWIEALRQAGQNVGVWHSDDLQAITIELSRLPKDAKIERTCRT